MNGEQWQQKRGQHAEATNEVVGAHAYGGIDRRHGVAPPIGIGMCRRAQEEAQTCCEWAVFVTNHPTKKT